MARRIEYAEARRGAIATLAGGMVAAGIALFAIVGGASPGRIRTALGVLAVGLLATAVVLLVAWGRQTNPPYGFIRTDPTHRPWKWFYRDALGDHKAFEYKWWLPKDTKVNKRPVDAFPDQWGPWVEREIGLADLRVDTLQNLRQTYLLHVNEKYKNLFLSQLRNVLIIGIVTSIAACLLAFTLGFGLPASHSAPTSGPPSVSISASP